VERKLKTWRKGKGRGPTGTAEEGEKNWEGEEEKPQKLSPNLVLKPCGKTNLTGRACALLRACALEFGWKGHRNPRRFIKSVCFKVWRKLGGTHSIGRIHIQQ
jgi:hypothetical protein